MQVNGQTRHVLEFTGEKNFTIVETVKAASDELQTVFMPGEMIDTLDVIGFYDGCLLYTSQFYYARELADHKRYAEAVDQYTAFLNAPDGWAENKIEACLGLAACYESLHYETKGALALLQAFLYAPPRAEVCCALGNYFYRQQAWNQMCIRDRL